MTECFTKKEVCDILNSLRRFDEHYQGYHQDIREVAYGDYFSVDEVAQAFGLETNCTDIYIPNKDIGSWG